MDCRLRLSVALVTHLEGVEALVAIIGRWPDPSIMEDRAGIRNPGPK